MVDIIQPSWLPDPLPGQFIGRLFLSEHSTFWGNLVRDSLWIRIQSCLPSQRLHDWLMNHKSSKYRQLDTPADLTQALIVIAAPLDWLFPPPVNPKQQSQCCPADKCTEHKSQPSCCATQEGESVPCLGHSQTIAIGAHPRLGNKFEASTTLASCASRERFNYRIQATSRLALG